MATWRRLHPGRVQPARRPGRHAQGRPRRADVSPPPTPSNQTEPLVDPDLDQTPLPYDQRLGHAFGELIEHLPVDQLPQSGRSTPRMVVEIDYQHLIDGLGAATLSSGTRISAAQARRLACNSGLLPMVLGGDSVLLDLDREQRLFDHHQRIALGANQHGCIADGCDRPPPGAKPTTAPPGPPAAAPT